LRSASTVHRVSGTTPLADAEVYLTVSIENDTPSVVSPETSTPPVGLSQVPEVGVNRSSERCVVPRFGPVCSREARIPEQVTAPPLDVVQLASANGPWNQSRVAEPPAAPAEPATLAVTAAVAIRGAVANPRQ
jgi:hypothetical protein